MEAVTKVVALPTCPVCGLPPDRASPSGYVCKHGHTWPRGQRDETMDVIRGQAAQRLATAPSNGQAAKPEPEQEHTSTWADGAQIVGRVRWAWERWLSPGFLHILAGGTGEGKSTLALRIATTYLLGWAWPDGSPFEGERGAVLWAESEGAQCLNYDRAQSWGLPMGMIRHPLSDPLRAVNLGNKRHRDALTSGGQAPEVRLIILDSLSAARPGRDENDSRALGDMGFLSDLARDTGKPLLVLHHLRKKMFGEGEIMTLDRLRGSSAICQLARIVWGLSIPDREHLERLRIECLKNNLGRYPAPLGMAIEEDGHVTFGEPPRAPVHLTDTQQAIIDALGELGETSASAVAERVGANRGNTSSRLQALVRLGLVKVRTANTIPLYCLVEETQECLTTTT